MSKLLCAFQCMLKRDLQAYARRLGDCLLPIFFLTLVSSVFSMVLASNPRLLATLSPALIWVGLSLALLLSLDSVFRSDAQTGVLEQCLLSPYPLSCLLLAKVMAHALMIGLPLLLCAPVLCVLLQGSVGGLGVLCSTVLLAIPTLTLIGSVGAALTVGLGGGGALLAIIVLPLMLPVLIFGVSALTAAQLGMPFYSEIFLLGACLLLALALAPVAIAAALRTSFL